MPPVEGFTVAHYLTVADLKRSAEFYKTVFDGEIVSMGDGNAPPYIKIANIWLILNVGGGPTPDKPMVTLSPPPDPNHIGSFMNIRVADIQTSYKLWKSRGATFLTEPIDRVRRDAMLHPRSRRLYYRSRPKQIRLQVRVEVANDKVVVITDALHGTGASRVSTYSEDRYNVVVNTLSIEPSSNPNIINKRSPYRSN